MTNPNIFRIMQQAKDRENGVPAHRFPSAEIKKALRSMGLRRTPGTNGEGRLVTVEVSGKSYSILATEA